VVTLIDDRQGRLWIGTKGAGLLSWENGKYTAYSASNGLPSNLAWSLCVDHENRLWIGTADGGLSWLHNGQFVNFTKPDGLADETVCHIEEDQKGRLWFTSPHGVSFVDERALEAFARGEVSSFSCTSYGQSDGMLSSGCTCAFQPSGCVTRDGRLLFPTLKGVAVVRPDAVEANPAAPPVRVEEVSIDGASRTLDGSATLRGPPGKARVEIRYTALSFSAPEKVRFKYRMEGLDTGWVDAGGKRVVDYSYLPHGDYKFSVLACNEDGVWGAEGASFELTIPPQFWQTWWFLGAAIAAGVSGIALTARRLETARAQRRMERQRQEHLVELERARIARDFHDEIGSCLTHVIVLSELVKGDKLQPKEVEAHASMIGKTARNAMQGLGTIIWAANPRNDTLDGLMQYISQYSYDFCQATPVACHLDLPPEAPPLFLTADVRHNLFMIVKEALHNVVKHSRASEACVNLRVEHGYLDVGVRDNGCGFDPAAVGGQGHGLASMRQRAEAIGAVLSIEARPGSGVSVRARFFCRNLAQGQSSL